LKSFTTDPSASYVRQDFQFHPGCDQLHSVSLLVRCDSVSPGNWLSTFQYKMVKRLLGVKCS